MLDEQIQCGCVQRHGAAAGHGLGWCRDDLAADLDQLLDDHELPRIEVDVDPAESADFTST